MSEKNFREKSALAKKALLILSLLSVILIIAGIIIISPKDEPQTPEVSDTSFFEDEAEIGQASPTDSVSEETEQVMESPDETNEVEIAEPETAAPLHWDLGNRLCVTNLGSYTGKYVEDGSDEEVSDILMLKLENRGEEPVEYAVLQMQIDDEVAEFTISALMPGAEVILLEKNRMEFDNSFDYTKTPISCVNYAKYLNPLELHEEQLSIQLLDGAVNVINISDTDIPGNITIYYKNKDNGVYLGGIAYRITIEGGIAAGEISQKMASHISASNSEILFVTIAE